MMKVPKDKYPHLAEYQENNPNGYEETIKDLLKLGNNPEEKEENLWGQLESDLEHLHLA